jgi:hypothetical protein
MKSFETIDEDAADTRDNYGLRPRGFRLFGVTALAFARTSCF